MKKQKFNFKKNKSLEPETDWVNIVRNYAFPADVGKYKIIDIEKYHESIKKHDIKMNQLIESCDIFRKFKELIEKDFIEQRLANEWNTYLQCDGYPKTHILSEIREYLYKIELLEKDLFDKTDSWIISINERSFLNQDINAKFQTKSQLKQHKIDYCNKYDNLIGKLLKVLNLLENTLKTRYKVDSAIIYDDLLKLKTEIHYKIKDLMDKLSYKIISNVDSQMSSISIQASDFNCNTNNFKMHIWTFNNIPMIIDETRFLKLNIPIQNMAAKVSLPLFSLEPNLTFRVTQLNYDHYSELTSSYHDISNQTEDFLESQILEWNNKNDLLKRIKEKLIKERTAYEEYLSAKGKLEEVKAKSEKKSDNVKKKKRKLISKEVPKEPPIVMPDDFPDIENDFLEQEDAIFQNIMENFHPKRYSFDENEVNMRQYYVPLGGIYEFNFILKPNQVIYPYIAVGLKTDQVPCILKIVKKQCPYEEGIDVESVASEINERNQNILKYYVIKIEIPTKYRKWAEPIPCQFISSQIISDHKDILEQKGHEINLNDNEIEVQPNSEQRKVEENHCPAPLLNQNEIEHQSNRHIISQRETSNIKNISHQDKSIFKTTAKWTTKHILKKKFNKDKGEIKIWTDRLGIFAFMCPKYIHFPFKTWSITSTIPNEVVFSVDSALAKYTFKISKNGYVVLVTNHYQRVIDCISYLQILEPISNMDTLKYIMLEQNLNIFPASDAGFYLEGYFSQKLFALENHTYDCMAAFSTNIQFHRSEWNCIAGYRNIVLKCCENTILKDKILDIVQINPDEARYVLIEEACTDITEVILNYKAAKEMDYCADLFNLISVSFPGSLLSRAENAKLFMYVSEILKNIQPLSFS